MSEIGLQVCMPIAHWSHEKFSFHLDPILSERQISHYSNLNH